MTPLAIDAFTVTSALGHGVRPHHDALCEGRGGLSAAAFESCTLPCWTGAVDGLDRPLTGARSRWDCRSHRLLHLALNQDGFRDAVAAAVSAFGRRRIGLFLGTSTSGIHQTERAYRERDRDAGRLPGWYCFRHTQSTFAAAEFVVSELGLEGPAQVISTACSSSAKVFASAHRAIQVGLCDAAVVAGVDSLCLTTLYGFNALQLLSRDVCRPADVHRAGLSIGEAAGFALLRPVRDGDRLRLLGYGESSDAYHMSAPDPDGRGALQAMRAALDRAGVGADDVDYVNLHGTATPANDRAEDRALCALFGNGVPCSSTKGYTGHTLGAAGIVEAAICLLCLRSGLLPKSLNTRRLDPELKAGYLLETRRARLRRALSNSFGFGGSNCCLLFGTA